MIRIELADPIDLGGEFVRWEVATAIAGVVLGIDPFDQPNVEEAKELTRSALAKAGRGRAADPAARGLAVTDPTLTSMLGSHIGRPAANAYIALQAFIAPTPERDEAFTRIRAMLRDATHVATTAGYGPRFLHSTGQLHKGGPATGLFLQLTADHPDDLDIPGWPYTFGQLIDAQADGDFAALESHQLSILRVHLGADPDAGLAALERALEGALRTISEG